MKRATMLALALWALAPTAAGCRPAAPVSAEGESPALRQAKALIDQNAEAFEAAVKAAAGVDSQPDKARQLGEQLRKGLEARKAEAEALEKKLTEEDRVKLREYGRSRLAPAVTALEKQLLGTTAPSAPQAAPAEAPGLPAAGAASPSGG